MVKLSRNRHTEACNLPIDEQEALKTLSRLQKEKQIVIKACDKGAGLIKLDYPEYMRACYKHLLSKQSETQSYYTQVDELEVDISKKKIDDIIKKSFENNIISIS